MGVTASSSSPPDVELTSWLHRAARIALSIGLIQVRPTVSVRDGGRLVIGAVCKPDDHPAIRSSRARHRPCLAAESCTSRARRPCSLPLARHTVTAWALHRGITNPRRPQFCDFVALDKLGIPRTWEPRRGR